MLLEVAVIVTALITAGSGLWYLKANYPLLVTHTIRKKNKR